MMATATRFTPVPVTPPSMVRLELTDREASDLRLLLAHLGGHADGTVRETLTEGRSSVYNALYQLGVQGSSEGRIRGLRIG